MPKILLQLITKDDSTLLFILPFTSVKNKNIQANAIKMQWTIDGSVVKCLIMPKTNTVKLNSQIKLHSYKWGNNIRTSSYTTNFKLMLTKHTQCTHKQRWEKTFLVESLQTNTLTFYSKHLFIIIIRLLHSPWNNHIHWSLCSFRDYLIIISNKRYLPKHEYFINSCVVWWEIISSSYPMK